VNLSDLIRVLGNCFFTVYET